MKPKTIILRLNEEQTAWLKSARDKIEHITGCQVEDSSILFRIMAKGLPLFEKELETASSSTLVVRPKPSLRLV